MDYGYNAGTKQDTPITFGVPDITDRDQGTLVTSQNTQSCTLEKGVQ